MSELIRHHLHPSPIGPLLLVWQAEALMGLHFTQGPKAKTPDPDWRADPAPFGEVTRQLDAYFAAELRAFDLPLAPRGSLFQKTVWTALPAIPYGRTRSYGALAAELGKPGSARAVGLANGANPIAIILPCHRVIGADGSLTGFGGGMAAKDYLLRLEGVRLNTQLSLF